MPNHWLSTVGNGALRTERNCQKGYNYTHSELLNAIFIFFPIIEDHIPVVVFFFALARFNFFLFQKHGVKEWSLFKHWILTGVLSPHYPPLIPLGYETIDPNHYQLRYSVSSDKHYFIVSPVEIILARERTLDDHVKWLIRHYEWGGGVDVLTWQHDPIWGCCCLFRIILYYYPTHPPPMYLFCFPILMHIFFGSETPPSPSVLMPQLRSSAKDCAYTWTRIAHQQHAYRWPTIRQLLPRQPRVWKGFRPTVWRMWQRRRKLGVFHEIVLWPRPCGLSRVSFGPYVLYPVYANILSSVKTPSFGIINEILLIAHWM